jgi:hypothetical protein
MWGQISDVSLAVQFAVWDRWKMQAFTHLRTFWLMLFVVSQMQHTGSSCFVQGKMHGIFFLHSFKPKTTTVERNSNA